MHYYRQEDFGRLSDFVVLESLMNGIPIKGHSFVLKSLCRLQDFPKSYLLQRLQKCELYIKKAQKMSGPARKYFKDLVAVSLGEIEAVLRKKTTVPKKKIRKTDFAGKIEKLHEELSKRGDSIWLI